MSMPSDNPRERKLGVSEPFVAVMIHSYFDPPPKLVVVDRLPSKTDQSELESTDVNRIVARFVKTGVLPAGRTDGVYLDVSQVVDYQDAVAQVNMAESFFMSLPAEVRARFQNDPAEFLDFASDPANRKEMQGWGLLSPDVVEPKAVEPAPEA